MGTIIRNRGAFRRKLYHDRNRDTTNQAPRDNRPGMMALRNSSQSKENQLRA